MDVNGETGEVELLDELDIDGAIVLQLTVGDGALVGVKAMLFDKGADPAPDWYLLAMCPHIPANGRARIDVACDR